MASKNKVRETMVLNGMWKIKYDSENVGKEKKWYERGKIRLDKAEEIPVPAFWDEYNDEDHTIAWYFKKFQIPSHWEDKIIEIHFEAVDYIGEVWLNGKFVGSHEGGYTPFQLDITKDAFLDKENLLVLRIVHPRTDKPVAGIKLEDIPQAKESGYYSFAGIWQDVTVIAKSKINIENIFVRPDIDANRVLISYILTNQTNELVSFDLVQAVNSPANSKTPVISKEMPVKLEMGRTEVDVELAFAQDTPAELWSLENPHLYTLSSKIVQDKHVIDEETVLFGMRKFAIEDDRFFFNNEKIFIKSALYQPDYGMTFAYPKDEKLARKEVEYAKKAGFNMLRMHIKTPPRIFVEMCDKLGMLLYVEPPIGWIAKTPHMGKRCLQEVREMVLKFRNNPSVVMWGMLNETGNYGFAKNGAQDIKGELALEARRFDPTRIIIDDSGGANNSKDPGHYYPHNSTRPIEFQDLHLYQRGPSDIDIRNYYRFIGHLEQMSFVSEFGFGGLEDLPAVMEEYEKQNKTHLKDYKCIASIYKTFQEIFKATNLKAVFEDFSDLAAQAQQLQASAARLHIEAIRLNPTVSGYCFTQFNDAGMEICAGMLDRLRNPKKVFATLGRTQSEVNIAFWPDRQNIFLGDSLAFQIHLIGEKPLPKKCNLKIYVNDPSDQTLLSEQTEVKVIKGVKQMNFSFKNIYGQPGVYKLIAELSQEGKKVTERTCYFNVLKKEKVVQSKKIALLEPNEDLEYFLHETATEYGYFDGNEVNFDILLVPTIANTIWAYPLEKLIKALDLVRQSKTVIFFELPPDAGEFFSKLNGNPIPMQIQSTIGGFMGVFHIVRKHDIFKDLPTNCIMDQDYCNVCPAFGLVMKGGENVVGSINTSNISAGQFMIEENPGFWSEELNLFPFGKGKIIFNQLRLLNNLKTDSIAWKIMVNLLEYADKSTSIAPDTLFAFDQKYIQTNLDKFTKSDEAVLQKWHVIGPFSNPLGRGLDIDYPPEKRIALDEEYRGIFSQIHWKTWYAKKSEDFKINLADVFTPIYCFYPRFEYWVAYACTSYNIDTDGEYNLEVTSEDGCKVWINNKLVFVNTDRRPPFLENEAVPKTQKVYLRKGENTVLAKVEKTSGPSSLTLKIEKSR